VLSAAAAAAASVSKGLPHLSGAAAHLMPRSWQLQKWPTETSECTVQRQLVRAWVHGSLDHIGSY
jgi:hypothetical protein